MFSLLPTTGVYEEPPFVIFTFFFYRLTLGGEENERNALDRNFYYPHFQLWNLSSELGIPVHCDGARILNSALYLDSPVKDLVAGCSSVSFCLSKGKTANAYLPQARVITPSLGDLAITFIYQMETFAK